METIRQHITRIYAQKGSGVPKDHPLGKLHFNRVKAEKYCSGTRVTYYFGNRKIVWYSAETRKKYTGYGYIKEIKDEPKDPSYWDIDPKLTQRQGRNGATIIEWRSKRHPVYGLQGYIINWKVHKHPGHYYVFFRGPKDKRDFLLKHSEGEPDEDMRLYGAYGHQKC